MKAATVYSADKAIYVRISIHAAREGGDRNMYNVGAVRYISIHAAREGGDFSGSVGFTRYILFQSTPPVKAATCVRADSPKRMADFNPRRP